MADGKLGNKIAEFRAEKEKRYAGFRVLLERALEAARDAVLAYTDVPPERRRRGAVWVRLTDGRSSFARFIRESEEPGWRRGNRRTGNYLPVSFPDLDKALTWARTFSGVLSDGGVGVKAEYSLISGRRDGE